MRVLLTGGSGFIGRHILESLGERYTIVAPRHAELDVTDAGQVDRILRTGRFDAVVHGAIQGGANVLHSTLRAYWNLARNADRVAKIVYFGSGAEYGKHRDLIKINEDAVGEETPKDDYGFAKLLCNQMTRESRNLLNLRLFGVYGPLEGYAAKFISNAVAKTLTGIPLTIRQDVIFDYLWVGDLMKLLPSFLERDRVYPDLNVTPTRSVSLTEIAAIVLKEGGSESDFEVETPGFNFQYTGDNSRLLSIEPGFAFTPVDEGIRRLFSYYRDRPATIDRDFLAADDYRRRCSTRESAGTNRETPT
jgi:GDP-L-fucose synthase